jgi:hypothetical protein
MNFGKAPLRIVPRQVLLYRRICELFTDGRCGAGASDNRYQMAAAADIQFLDHSILVSFFLAGVIPVSWRSGHV